MTRAKAKEKKEAHNQSLAEVLEAVLDEQDYDLPCLVCNF
jgi:hypothetical protein